MVRRRLRYLLEHGRHALRAHRSVVGNALRVTVASCVAFYVCRYALGLTVMSVYAMFTVVSLGVLARIPGSGRQRATTVLTAIPAGLALVTLGTLLAVQTWSAVLGMLVIGFLVAYAGTTGPRIAGAAPGMQLLYILPCFPPYAPDALGQRLSGFLLGAVLLALAQRFLVPEPDTPPFRRLLADAADAAARLADHHGGTLPVQALTRAHETGDALRPSRVPPADLPASPTLAHKAMAHATEAVRTLLARLEALHASVGPRYVYHTETVVLLESIGDAAREAAQALRRGKRLRPGEGPSAAVLQSELAPARAHRAVDTLERLSGDDRLVYLRRRSQVVQAADSTVVLALATRLLLGDRSVGLSPAAHGFSYARARLHELWWQRLTTHLTPRSVIFQNACRFALGLAAARAVAGLLDLQHGFWVLLATLTLTRTTSLETWSAVRQALAGTLVGAVLAGGLLALVHDRDMVYAVVLPVVMLVAFIAGPLRGLAWAQGGFTLVVATLFAQVSPVTWQLAPVRLVDVVVGSLIGLGCGLVAWPRGAGREVRRSMAGLCSAIADAIGYTTARVVDHSGSADCLEINRALVLAQESLAQYHCELRDESVGPPDWPSVLVAGAEARRGERLLPGRPGRIASREVRAWLRRAADRTAADYRSLARQLHADGEVPPVAVRPLDIRALLAVAPAVPRHSPDREARALSAALLLDSVIWLDALTADLDRIRQEM
ncbi:MULTISPECIES: FUSC family protein [unclassified Streptomyces]|nr:MULTISPECIES: FUSC family protein [unclassified Streptomyces]PBC80745.1 fusaric acid resistance family protein [Streptomyces sp. 2321.6]SDR57444.1 Fusaric acid resistance protein-like [Streptomyces sp. KS_16]SEB86874.1 Fusaric acid resistance protein-like [Streptomyces sp. 2133.1]SNC61943.1 Fusaric acid resistance protein-like [Streptomyces sp. 2114.4]